MMRLFRRLADEGRSIVCITHNVDNVEQCHLALVLARGKIVYFGPPHEAPRYFRVRRISDIYDRLSEKSLADWEREYLASEAYQEFVAGRLAARPADSAEMISLPAEEIAPRPVARSLSSLLADSRKLVSLSNWPPLADRFRELTARYLRVRKLFSPVLDLWHQFRVLTARYLELIVSDRRGLRLLLLQAPLVAVFLLIGFVNKDYRSEIPMPRPLTESERHLLIAVKGLEELSSSDRLTPEQRQALERLRQPALDAAQTKALRDAHFTVDVNGTPTPVTGAELMDAANGLREARITDNLLSFDGPVVPDRRGINPRFTYILQFIVVMIVLWFGCNNAAKEIVKEEAIYGRERAVNLGIVPYLASKFLVQGLITAFHALVLMVLVYGTLELLQMTRARLHRAAAGISAGVCAAIWRIGATGDERRGTGPASVGVRLDPGPRQRAVAVCADPATDPRRRHYRRAATAPFGFGDGAIAGLLGLPRHPSRRRRAAARVPRPRRLCRWSRFAVRRVGRANSADADGDGVGTQTQGGVSGDQSREQTPCNSDDSSSRSRVGRGLFAVREAGGEFAIHRFRAHPTNERPSITFVYCSNFSGHGEANEATNPRRVAAVLPDPISGRGLETERIEL